MVDEHLAVQMQVKFLQDPIEVRRERSVRKVSGDIAFVLSYFDIVTQRRWIRALKPEFKKFVQDNIITPKIPIQKAG